MRIVRGGRERPEADRELTAELVSTVAERGERLLRVWQPPRQVAFGRRDTTRDGYDRARERLRAASIPFVERSVGGHAVYFSGTTLSFVRATPVGDARSSITERYEAATADVRAALDRLGVDATAGEPDSAFCPGTHSLSADGKIVGLAQRLRRDRAVVSGIVVVRDYEEIGSVLGPVYDALDLPFDRSATGSLARAGGVADPDAVCRALETALADGDPTVERVRET